jgi:hypothetical protein
MRPALLTITSGAHQHLAPIPRDHVEMQADGAKAL